jgi:hypothetical protein
MGSGTLNGSGVATLTATISPGANAITAQYIGNAQFAPSTSAAITVLEPDFSITANESSLTVTAGGSGNVSLTLTPVGDYSGTVSMSCSTALAGVSCTFNPASYTLDGSNTVLTGTATIVASSTASLARPEINFHDNRLVAGVVWLPAGLLGLLIAFQRPRLRRNPRTYRLLFLLVLVPLTVSLSACGSGGGGGGGGGGGTQPVTGTVTITAVGSTANVTQTSPLSVTVN